MVHKLSSGHSTRKTTPGMPVENKVESGLIDCMLNGTRIVLPFNGSRSKNSPRPLVEGANYEWAQIASKKIAKLDTVR
jgi:hypothetical protein